MSTTSSNPEAFAIFNQWNSLPGKQKRFLTIWEEKGEKLPFWEKRKEAVFIIGICKKTLRTHHRNLRKTMMWFNQLFTREVVLLHYLPNWVSLPSGFPPTLVWKRASMQTKKKNTIIIYFVILKESLVLICKRCLMSMNKTECWGWNILRTTVSVVVLILNEICIQ